MNKYYGQFQPPVDELLHKRYFPQNVTKGVFMECGACGGKSESSCLFFEETLGWQGVNIEPSPPNFANLIQNRPESINLQVGLSNFDGKSKFLHAIHPNPEQEFGNGSIQHNSQHFQQLSDMGCTFKEYEIEVITWKTLISRLEIEYVDIFVLDVEGHELAVLDGMENSKVFPDIICIEVGHQNFSVIRKKLDDYGYVFDFISHTNAFFVKKEVSDFSS
ncbi:MULTISPECIES: FkbM family methyltransferase [unclassified Polynucleobacter]|uniref:FkbM family methyltransferase n=1 Tax=unclassified Polynucleobacter TaxID=2640945 RepID=UPI002490767F|nr:MULTISPECIES: FkbM family methyltransferase [unclassified Polynucleobacter]